MSRPTPTGTPAIFTSSPGTSVGGVVEDRADVVGLRRVVVGGLAHDRRSRSRARSPRTGRCRRAASWAGRGRGRVAALRRRAAPSRRAAAASRRPGSGCRCPSRSLGAASGGHRRHAARRPRRRCGQEHRLDAGVVAVGVVVGGDLAELREPAGEVGRVAAHVLEHRLRAVERPDRAREDAWRSAAPAAAAWRSARSGRCSGPGARISSRRSAIVGRASRTSGRSSRRKGASSLVAGFDSSTSGRGRRASRAG